MNDQYFINTVSGKRGPFSFGQLKKAAENGILPKTAAVAVNNADHWIMAKTIPGLFEKDDIKNLPRIVSLEPVKKRKTKVPPMDAFEAAAKGNLRVLKYWLKNGGGVNSRREFFGGWTLLHLATDNGQIKTMQYLIKNGVIGLAVKSCRQRASFA